MKKLVEKVEAYRGYPITIEGNNCYFQGTDLNTAPIINTLPCGHCNKHNTPKGHDACLSHLTEDRNIMNACCGHGVIKDAYIQLWKGGNLSGQEALDYSSRKKEFMIGRNATNQ